MLAQHDLKWVPSRTTWEIENQHAAHKSSEVDELQNTLESDFEKLWTKLTELKDSLTESDNIRFRKLSERILQLDQKFTEVTLAELEAEEEMAS